MLKLAGPAGRLGLCAAVGLGFALAGCAAEPVEEVAPAPPQIVMEGERLFPESITSDAAGNIYIGSNPGMIFKAAIGDETAPVWITPDEENGLATVFGVLADDARGLLWVCSNDMVGGGAPAIKTFSLADGSFVASYPLEVDGPAMCNDMTIAADGDVFASEMAGGRIVKLADGGDAFEVWATDPEFASLDGISFGPGGELYANAIQRNTLLHIAMDDDGTFAGTTVLETSQPMNGPDGLRPLDDTRMVQSEGNSGTITVLTFAEEGPVQVDVIADGIDYASSVTVANGRAFYPEGKLSFLFDPNKQMQDPGDFIIRNAEIPGGE